MFSSRLQDIDLDEFEDHSTEDITQRMARTEALAQELGKSVAKAHAAFVELLTELVTSDDGSCGRSGGDWLTGRPTAQDVAAASHCFGSDGGGRRRLQVFQGFLYELRAIDTALTTALLDDAVEHEVLAAYYPFLQVAVALDSSDIARLKRSVSVGRAPAVTYGYLAYGRATDPIPGPEFRQLSSGLRDCLRDTTSRLKSCTCACTATRTGKNISPQSSSIRAVSSLSKSYSRRRIIARTIGWEKSVASALREKKVLRW